MAGQGEPFPVVVTSAHSGVTDELLAQARNAAKGKFSLRRLRRRHKELLAELGVDFELVAPLLAELGDLLRGLSLVRELTPRSLDLVASFGERMAVRGIAAFLRAGGLPAEAIDAYDLGLRTDSAFTIANPLPESLRDVGKALKQRRGTIPVVTGFIAKDKHGDITTLGRSGSDFTATLVGAAAGVDEVQIWTDVDGVMTADPRLVKSAKSVPVLSIAEASELAYYGARVIHPATMVPAVENRIPVRVLNTSHPELPGTVILAEIPSTRRVVKSVAYKSGVILITVESSRMLLQPGFMAKIFEVFARYDMSVDLVATSEVTVSVTVDSDDGLDGVVADLSSFSKVAVERDLAQVSIVGEGIRERVGVAAEVFATLKRARTPVRLISHGGTKINISFLVDDDMVKRTVRGLHRTFFE